MTQNRLDAHSTMESADLDQPTRPSSGPDGARGSTGFVPRPRSQPALAELIIRRGPDTGARFAITQQGVTIGRRREYDIMLDDPTVSRLHAELSVGDGGGRFTIADRGSLNGTYVNRRAVDVAELADGDEVWIGKIRFTFHTAG